MIHVMEAWDTVLDISSSKEDKKFCSKEVIRLDYLDSYPYLDYVTPSADVLFIPYYDPSPYSWEGGDQ